MSDPLAEVVSLLKPSPSISKLVTGGGRWIVERTELGSPFYCAVVEGRCRLSVADRQPILLTAGDFVLVPDIYSFTMGSIEPPSCAAPPQRLETSPGVFRLGDPEAPVEVRAMVGHCAFVARERTLLVSLLPEVIHVHGEDRLTTLVGLIHDETRSGRVARDMVLGRLLEVLLIEALRSFGGETAPPGLLRGLADPQLAAALRRVHDDPGGNITVAALARDAAMSRSTFFDRFRCEVGVAPMEYATTWRMALAKKLLRRDVALADIARRVGYGSASAFSVAFSRHVGTSPGAYSRYAPDE
ncbi:AraC family transcriptional regulator [Neorhizobium galegae]|uniref:AraC family transcriptional regulator n=1 Tax=Neorhizobium galegae TaxID=399 RepID=UPI002105C226|nr:AraC family transcriptional regulator [Neorhizobium galegae]MCQ1852832.1 AraC family transcriptional regulator [Neorhizobium galegae]